MRVCGLFVCLGGGVDGRRLGEVDVVCLIDSNEYLKLEWCVSSDPITSL